MSKEAVKLETIVALAKHRGFVFPGSEIYGGLANSWDYGPLGVLLKNNLRDAWWKHFVMSRRDMVGLDAAILMNPRVWEASGHVRNFNDPLVEDKVTHKRYRADHLLAEAGVTGVAAMDLATMHENILKRGLTSPDGHELTAPRRYNLLFETALGSVEGDKSKVYLRGEIAQSMFINFKRVMDSQRMRVPFGIASVGKAFRNEITPGNFTFRTLEFDLMEFEYFVREHEWKTWFDYWLTEMQRWVIEDIGLTASRLRVREHEAKELAHYSKRTVDIEYQTPFGFKELFGLAYRADFDLKNHSQESGQDLSVLDVETNERYFPHVVEPTFGLTRLMLMVMLDAYDEEVVGDDTRVVLRLKPQLAPYQVAVLPLSNKSELRELAESLADQLGQVLSLDYDVTQSIGKRYRRQDEIGTPYCVTVDFDSLEDNAVTIRDRDSMKQERVAIDEVASYLVEKLAV